MGTQAPPYVPAPVDKRTKIEKWADLMEGLMTDLDLDELRKCSYLEYIRVNTLAEIFESKVFSVGTERFKINSVDQLTQVGE